MRTTMSKTARTLVAAAVGATSVVAVGLSAGGPAGAATPAASSSATAAVAASTYEAATVDNQVAIRTAAKRSAHANGYMEISGSIFYVYCYVSGENISGDKIWYRGAHPDPFFPNGRIAGYVAGYNLDTGHDPRKGIAHC